MITDQEGSFIIEEIPVGRYNLLFSYVGYESFIMREVVVGTAKEAFLDVGMRELVYEMDEVSVAANVSKDQPINPMAGVSARSFTVEETERYAGSWGDPARMASNYAGVFQNGDIFNYLVIRGNSPNGLIWRMEGIPIPN
ncbi:MAG: TonB-dependent receptor, partial [bacterium]